MSYQPNTPASNESFCDTFGQAVVEMNAEQQAAADRFADEFEAGLEMESK